LDVLVDVQEARRTFDPERLTAGVGRLDEPTGPKLDTARRGNCHHEVRLVKEGHRVVLTYNLFVEADTTVADAPSARVDALAGCVARFFETPSPPRWSGGWPAQPARPPGPSAAMLCEFKCLYRSRLWRYPYANGIDWQPGAQ
jgi:hypothetical protein